MAVGIAVVEEIAEVAGIVVAEEIAEVVGTVVAVVAEESAYIGVEVAAALAVGVVVVRKVG